MSLRELAEQDLAFILEDEVTGFGWPVTLVDPAGQSANLTASTTDIGQILDPDTGTAVSGRVATASLRLSSIFAEGLSMPRGVADVAAGDPWRVIFNDINGQPFTFKVNYSDPDRTLGIIVLTLGVWE